MFTWQNLGLDVTVIIRLATRAREVFQKVATPTSTIECDRTKALNR
jgi:hypothetical protein